MTIRFLKYNEMGDLQHFLKQNWRSSILDKNDNFFRWTYCRNLDIKHNNIDFVADIDQYSKKILACAGIIQTKNFVDNYDNRISNTVWITNWKSINGNGIKGLKLIKYIEDNLKYELIGTIGCNTLAKNIYKALGYDTGSMRRLVAINFNRDSYQILKSNNVFEYKNNIPPRSVFLEDDVHLNNVYSLCDLKELFINIGISKSLPSKDYSYYLNRYYFHPIYKYDFLQIKTSNFELALVLRKCFYKGSFAFRIVDILGELSCFFNVCDIIMKYLFKEDPEYVDIYFLDQEKSLEIDSSYFVEINQDSNLIVPSYFEPYVYSSPMIYWAYKTTHKPHNHIISFKGDCDQDRPS